MFLWKVCKKGEEKTTLQCYCHQMLELLLCAVGLGPIVPWSTRVPGYILNLLVLLLLLSLLLSFLEDQNCIVPDAF